MDFGLMFRRRGLRRKPFQRNAEPLCGFFLFFEYAYVDRRVLGDYGMQLAIVNDGVVGRHNCRLHRWPIQIGKNSMERNLNDVSEIQLYLIVTEGIEESIERLLQVCFQIFDNADDPVNRLLVQQTTRPVNE